MTNQSHAFVVLAAISLGATFVPSFASVLSDGSTPERQSAAPGHMLMRGGMGGGGYRGGGGGYRGGGMGGGGYRGGGMGGGYRGGGEFGGGERGVRSSAQSNVNFAGGNRQFGGGNYNGNRSFQGGGNYNGNGNFSGNRNVNVNNYNGGYRGGYYGGGYNGGYRGGYYGGGCNGGCGGWGNGWDHPVAAAATIGAAAAVTSAAIGSVAYSVPPSCGPVTVTGVSYYQCGSTWYQPRYQGTDVQYVVVNPPE